MSVWHEECAVRRLNFVSGQRTLSIAKRSTPANSVELYMERAVPEELSRPRDEARAIATPNAEQLACWSPKDTSIACASEL